MRLRLLGVILCLLPAMASAQDEYQQLQDLLQRGLYNSAALVAGPALVEANPADRRARYLYGLALYLAGDIDAARRELDVIMGEGGPENADERNLLGLILAAEGDVSAALPLLEEAFLDSGRYSHAMDLARVAWQGFELDLALDAYGQAAATQRGAREPWPWLNMGRILLIQDRFAEAATALERAIEVYEASDSGELLPSPAYVEAFYRLGTLHEELYGSSGDETHLTQAMDNYRNALVGDPNYAPARSALSRLEQQ
jgi:tetratricopeptide (TPR) repeat protein